MGVVYAAFDRELEREVAIKVLRVPVSAAQAEEWKHLLRRESRTLARLESRNIVAVHDVRRGKDFNYIVMDIVHGKDLQTVISRCAKEHASYAGGKLEALL